MGYNTSDVCATVHLKGRGVGQGVHVGDAGQLCCAALDSALKHSVSIPTVLAECNVGGVQFDGCKSSCKWVWGWC